MNADSGKVPQATCLTRPAGSKAGRVIPCVPQFASEDPDGAHGVTRLALQTPFSEMKKTEELPLRSAIGSGPHILDRDDMQTVERHDLTIVQYSTDNGPHYNTWPDAGTTPFRSEKNSNWEGAYRVPCFIKWPGHFPGGHDAQRHRLARRLAPGLAKGRDRF